MSKIPVLINSEADHNLFAGTKIFLQDQQYKWRTNTQSKNFFKVFGLMLFVAVFGAVFLGNMSLRLDESQSLWQSAHSVPILLKIVAQDVHVPLYHLILHYFQVFFGSGVFSARLVSLLFFVATIPAVYALGKRAYGANIALFAAVLVAVSPFLNWYGNETRMYSMLVFITVLNQYFFIRLFKEDSPGLWWGFAITAFLGMFTHYFFFLSLFSEFLFLFVYKDLFSIKARRRFMTIALVLAILFLPWLYYVYHLGFASTTQPKLQTPTSYNIFDTFTQFIFGFQSDHLDTILVALWPVTMLIALLGLRRDRRTGERRKIPPYTTFFLMAAIFPIILVFLISFLKPIYLSRYLILTIPSLYLFLSWLIATFPENYGRFSKFILVGAMLITLASQTASATSPVKEDYKAVVDYITVKASAQDAIILSAPFTVYPVEYYYKGPAAIETLPQWDRYAAGGLPAFSEQNLPAEVKADNADFKNVYLLLSFDQGYNDTIRIYYETHFKRIDQKSFSPGLSLWVYQVKY